MVCIRLLPPLNYSNYITYYNPCQDFLALINNAYSGPGNRARKGPGGGPEAPPPKPGLRTGRGAPKGGRKRPGSDSLRKSVINRPGTGRSRRPEALSRGSPGPARPYNPPHNLLELRKSPGLNHRPARWRGRRDPIYLIAQAYGVIISK